MASVEFFLLHYIVIHIRSHASAFIALNKHLLLQTLLNEWVALRSSADAQRSPNFFKVNCNRPLNLMWTSD